MIVAQFKIRTSYTPPERWFWVRVYESADSLRKVANRVDVQRGGSGSEYADCVGCVQEITPMLPEEMDPKLQDSARLHHLLQWPGSGFAGVVRLCAEWLTPEVVAHEITHAALTVHRMNLRQRPLLEGMLAPERPNEEALAYAVGQLFAETHAGLYARGFR